MDDDSHDPQKALEGAIEKFIERVIDDNFMGAELSVRYAFAIATIYPELAESSGVGPLA